MKTTTLSSLIFTVVCLLTTPLISTAQDTGIPQDPAELEQLILRKDSLFWEAYNNCDIAAFATFISDDLEFYHDKGGLTSGGKTLLNMIETGLCGNSDNRLRREAVAGSIEVFPIATVGALISGRHYFYVNEGKRPEYLDGQARFTHLWRYERGEWRMARVFSYDHGPAPATTTEKVKLSELELAQYTGKFQSQQTGPIEITVENNALLLRGQEGFSTKMLPSGQHNFSMPGRNVRFEFSFDPKGQIEKITVFENDVAVDEARPIE